MERMSDGHVEAPRCQLRAGSSDERKEVSVEVTDAYCNGSVDGCYNAHSPSFGRVKPLAAEQEILLGIGTAHGIPAVKDRFDPRHRTTGGSAFATRFPMKMLRHCRL